MRRGIHVAGSSPASRARARLSPSR
jgi:hypothetical protein